MTEIAKKWRHYGMMTDNIDMQQKGDVISSSAFQE